jgi:hypothetical protein
LLVHVSLAAKPRIEGEFGVREPRLYRRRSSQRWKTLRRGDVAGLSLRTEVCPDRAWKAENRVISVAVETGSVLVACASPDFALIESLGASLAKVAGHSVGAP